MLSQTVRNHCIASIAVILMVSGCSGQPSRTTAAAVPQAVPAPMPVPAHRGARRTPAQSAAITATRQVGVPYQYGGSTTRGFDCSGLISYAYATAGKAMPRTTSGLWRELKPVDANNLQVGDVLFFSIEGKMSHVGLYLGDRRFVHAPSSGKTVTVGSLDSGFYRRALIRGGRPR